MITDLQRTYISSLVPLDKSEQPYQLNYVHLEKWKKVHNHFPLIYSIISSSPLPAPPIFSKLLLSHHYHAIELPLSQAT